MPTPILMPALSPTMEAGTLAKWLVKEGDSVASGDVIAEIETDKATMEVEAVDEGTVGKLLVGEGTADVPVNEPIAMLLAEGENADDLDEAAVTGAPPRPEAAGGKDADEVAKDAGKTTPDQPTDPAQAKAERAPGGSADTTRTGNGEAPQPKTGGNGKGEAPRRDVNGASKPAAGTPSQGERSASGERIFASPLARRLAAEGGIDLSSIEGSGPHGRIVKRDVEGAKASGAVTAPDQARAEAPTTAASEGGQTPPPAKERPAAPPPTGAPPGMADDEIRALFQDGSFEERPHDGMRKTIARRLTESKQTIPHFYLTRDVELDALLSLRGELNAAAPTDNDGNPAYKLSVNDFIIKALALALRQVPTANATFTSASRLFHAQVDVGVAVAIPDGLITPVVRNADTKTLSVISNEMKDLAKRARQKKLQPREYQGGTTAVSNLGMFGIRDFAAVINPPHGSILAVGEGVKRPVVKDGALAIATVMTVTLSVDHRAVDGALGAEVLQAFAKLVEAPMRLMV